MSGLSQPTEATMPDRQGMGDAFQARAFIDEAIRILTEQSAISEGARAG